MQSDGRGDRNQGRASVTSNIHSLKLQMSLAIGVLIALFSVSTIYSLHVIDQQSSDDSLVHLAGRLQFNEQHLAVQAMRYRDNAPRDYPSYYRDLELYFADLKKTRESLNTIVEAFANNRFEKALSDRRMPMIPNLPPRSQAVAVELGKIWRAFDAKVDERIGPDPEEPRLEWAAEWIAQEHGRLEGASSRLMTTLERDVAERARRANLVNRVILVGALLVAMGITFWFYRRVLRPLAVAVEGFHRVANGDFHHRVAVELDNEIGLLSRAFNRLTDRLEALKRLLTGLQHDTDLEAALAVLSRNLPSLIPVDWIGVLVLGADGRIHLEQAYSDGRPENLGKLSFEPAGTVLEECLNGREPLHIADVQELAHMSEHYQFLRQLVHLGRQDALFLPIGNDSTVQGVAVFANRYPNSFRAEHIEWLHNLGVLLGVSLGRTLQLIESSRLATIGQFASGIVHEIRNPLATIGLAFDHLKTVDALPAGAVKRVDLAAAEVDRLERLLGEILLYAKPLTLDRTLLDPAELLRVTLAPEVVGDTKVQFDTAECPSIAGDPDRLRQVLINLVRNAQEASSRGTAVTARCRATRDGWVELAIINYGEPLSEQLQERLFEPFFTSKRGGTGLGLSIVQRIVQAHGGQVTLASDPDAGTTQACVRLPPARAIRPPDS